MDIKDLEFIRDLSDHISTLRNDIGELAECMEDDDDLRSIYHHFTYSLFHQAQLVEKILDNFKREVDEKYWVVWKTAYPKMTEKDIDHPDVQREIKDAVAKTLKENEGIFPSIDEQFQKIQEERLNDQ